MNVPLIQKPETNDINASLIAIRKQLQILNESVNNIENKYLLKSELKELSADTVGGDGKYIESISENNGIINAVEKSLGNMTPVDTVTSGNTHSVTSNAVAEALAKIPLGKFQIIKNVDLNDMRDTSVIYYQDQTSWVNTLANRPTFLPSGEMALINIPLGSNNYTTQIYIGKAGLDHFIAQRVYNNGSWSDWVRIDGGIILNPLTLTYTMKSGYSASNIIINTMNYSVGSIAVFQILISNINGSGIGTTNTTEIAQTNLRPKQDCYAIGIDYRSGRPVRLAISTNGMLIVNESLGVTNGNNALVGVFVMPN